MPPQPDGRGPWTSASPPPKIAGAGVGAELDAAIARLRRFLVNVVAVRVRRFSPFFPLLSTLRELDLEYRKMCSVEGGWWRDMGHDSALEAFASLPDVLTLQRGPKPGVGRWQPTSRATPKHAGPTKRATSSTAGKRKEDGEDERTLKAELALDDATMLSADQCRPTKRTQSDGNQAEYAEILDLPRNGFRNLKLVMASVLSRALNVKTESCHVQVVDTADRNTVHVRYDLQNCQRYPGPSARANRMLSGDDRLGELRRGVNVPQFKLTLNAITGKLERELRYVRERRSPSSTFEMAPSRNGKRKEDGKSGEKAKAEQEAAAAVTNSKAMQRAAQAKVAQETAEAATKAKATQEAAEEAAKAKAVKVAAALASSSSAQFQELDRVYDGAKGAQQGQRGSMAAATDTAAAGPTSPISVATEQTLEDIVFETLKHVPQYPDSVLQQNVEDK